LWWFSPTFISTANGGDGRFIRGGSRFGTTFDGFQLSVSDFHRTCNVNELFER
jgi:hypothetical protein